MRALTLLLAATIVSLTAGAALAAPRDPNVFATVTGVDPTSVTQSRVVTLKNGATFTMTSYAAYQVVLTNNTTNSLNNAYFNATAVNNATPSVAVIFDSFIQTTAGPTVTCNTPSTSLSCSLGNLAPGTTSGTFVVFVRAPTTGTSITLSFSSGGFEGGSGSNSCCTYRGTNSQISLIDLSTSPTYSTHALSLLTKVGGKFFTGSAAVPNFASPFGTSLSVPALGVGFTYSTAAIDLDQDIPPTCSSPNLIGCHQSQLTIPTSISNPDPLTFSGCNPSDATSYGNCLNIVLRVDSSQIKSGAKIGNVVVTYDGGTVYPCAVLPTLPCIVNTVDYKKKSVPGWSPELDGDWEWNIINDRNGLYRLN